MTDKPIFAPRKSSTPSISLSPIKRGRGVSQSSLDSAEGARDVKKLVIHAKARPAVSARSDPASHPTQAISVLARAIHCITADPPEPSPESLQSLYSLCEGIAAAGSKTAQQLYDRIRLQLDRRIAEVRQRLCNDAAAHEDWLKAVETQWKQFLQQMLLIRSIFLPIDRTFVLHQTSLLSIWDLGIDIFRHQIVEEAELGPRITASLLHFVEQERHGQIAPRSLFSSVVSLLSSISSTTYVSTFIQPFLDSSRTFFATEGNAQIQQLSPAAYLQATETRLQAEGERCLAVLDPSSTYAIRASITRVLEETLIASHVSDLLPAALDDGLASTSSRQDLARLYSLLARVNALDKLRISFAANIEREGYKLVESPERDETMVQSLIDYKLVIDGVVREAFAGDEAFASAARTAFAKFINKRQNKPAEMMAKFVDAKMRAGNRGMTDAELEATFDQVLALFRYTQGKDVWEAFYTRLFAKRLLLNKSASSDMEKLMLGKLRQESGAAFTSKLETMAKDIDLSGDLTRAYKHTNFAANDSCDLAVNVLTTGNWPSFTNQAVALPADLVRSLDRFRDFYASKHSGRVLAWQHSLDQCTLRARFGTSRKELNVSLYQTLVLLLFNNLKAEETLSVEEIAASTKLTGADLTRTLQSLACGKIRVLTKQPKGRDVEPGDTFAVNETLKTDNYKLKINQIQIKETAEEQKKTTTSVLLERKLVLEAAIVRFMKARKTMSHTDLVMETVSQLKDRFKVEPSEIKKAIDSLIEREYMQRGETRGVYDYLA